MLQFSPNLVAGNNINPYRIVKMDTTAFTGVASTAAGFSPAGDDSATERVKPSATKTVKSAKKIEARRGLSMNCIRITLAVLRKLPPWQS